MVGGLCHNPVLSVSSICKTGATRRPSWKGVAACSSSNGRLAVSVGVIRALGNLVWVETIFSVAGSARKKAGRDGCFSRRGRAESCYR